VREGHEHDVTVLDTFEPFYDLGINYHVRAWKALPTSVRMSARTSYSDDSLSGPSCYSGQFDADGVKQGFVVEVGVGSDQLFASRRSRTRDVHVSRGQ